jgi:murein tripeptide amidase MpaA
MNVTEVESSLIALEASFPSQCELITLPNLTHEGRTSHAIRIANGPLDSRPSILFIGGQHAREWGSAEICINFATDVLEAYTGGTGIVYGGKSYSSTQVQSLVNNYQVFVFPCVNPDGRNFSQTVDAMWRKNRNPIAGVDNNRNYDYLWDFPVSFAPGANPASTNPASDTYRGSAPNSEPENKNVVWLLDTYPQIRWMIDIHSYSQLIYHNWGDDENQILTPSMNFTNAAFNGQRGLSGDAYKEYIPPADLAAERCLVTKMRDALQAVRGKTYSIGQSFELYPTSGTATDYPYSRHFTNPAKTKTLGFLIEWGTEFQPAWAEMENIIVDVSSALVEFCLAAPCRCSTIDASLLTPSIHFNDVPEGELTSRAVVFSVISCQEAHFEIVPPTPTVLSGPGSFGTLVSSTSALPVGTGITTRQARLWITFQGTAAGDSTTGEVKIRLQETGEEWTIPIAANTIERPTVATVLVLDQSGSMSASSGLSSLPTRNDVLKFAAPVFVNLLQEGNGIGIVDFDHNAYDRMDVETVGPTSAFDPARNNALGFIMAHTPNPSGLTAIGDGIEHAHNFLADETGFMHKAMVVFTDGYETDSKYISEVMGLINERVFAIGLGTASQIQPTALSAITNNTGGYLLMTGAIGNDDLFRLSKYYLQILAGVTNMNIVLDPEGYVKPGSKHRIPFYLTEADISIDVILLYDATVPVFRFELETPSGERIVPASAASVPGVSFHVMGGLSFYRCTLPIPVGMGAHAGKWNVVISIDDKYYKKYLSSIDNNKDLLTEINTHGVRYNLNIHSFSGLKFEARLLQTSHEPGAELKLRAVLTEYNIPVSKNRASVYATFTRPDNTTGSIALIEEGVETGIYVAQETALLSGVYTFRIMASGNSLRNHPFTREQIVTGTVWKGGDDPLPAPTGDPKNDKICELLQCLFGEKVITKEMEETLKKQGVNLKELRNCLKKHCR